MAGLVSIIMPAYETGLFIEDSIKSVLSQTYTNWELIIVDDNSKDNTDDIVGKYLNDKRIRYFKNQNNCGAAVSRNLALSKAKGKWIAFLDSDDLWIENKLEKQIQFMEKNDYHFSYTSYVEIDVNGNATGIIVTGPKRITQAGFLNYCWVGCLTVMYDRDFVGDIQIEDIKKNNDYAIWLKVSKKADCYYINEVLAKYRHGRKGSVSNHSIWTMIGWHYKLFKEAEGYNFIVSSCYTIRNLFFGLYKKIRYVNHLK